MERERDKDIERENVRENDERPLSHAGGLNNELVMKVFDRIKKETKDVNKENFLEKLKG